MSQRRKVSAYPGQLVGSAFFRACVRYYIRVGGDGDDHISKGGVNEMRFDVLIRCTRLSRSVWDSSPFNTWDSDEEDGPETRYANN